MNMKNPLSTCQLQRESSNPAETTKNTSRSDNLSLTSDTMMSAEDNDISMNADTNEIVRMNTKAIKRETTGKHTNEIGTQRIDKRHVREDTFRPLKCNEESDLSTAEFSLNEPPACKRSDGSAYHPPEPKKAQILQKPFPLMRGRYSRQAEC